MIVGVLFGVLLRKYAPHGVHAPEGMPPQDFVQKLFLRLKEAGPDFILLIKMLVAPLVFSTLVVGLCSAGHKHMGRLLLKALVWFWLASAVALAIGLASANYFKPGVGAPELATKKEKEKLQAEAKQRKETEDKKDFVKTVVPVSIVQAMSENSILPIVFFGLLFGIALSSIGTRGQPVVSVLKGVSEAMFTMTNYVMYLAPVGVGGAMAYAVADKGFLVLLPLLKLIGALYIALVVFVVLLVVAVKLLTRVHMRVILRELAGSLLIAFSTASSETVLPRVILSLERLGVPSRIAGLVVPSGYSFNLDGTTLYMALAMLFIIQAEGIQGKYGVWEQLGLMGALLISSKGVAAVPRASLIVITSVCVGFGIETKYIATIFAVDTIMDMARTSVNVLGNALAAVVVAKWEKALSPNAPLYTGMLPPLEEITLEPTEQSTMTG